MDQLGGTCLQRGCIPTKAILHSVKAIKQINDFAKIGVRVEKFQVSLEEIERRKTRIVSKQTRGIELLFKQNNVQLIKGRAPGDRGPTPSCIDGQKEVTARHIVIATGSRPAELPFLKWDGQKVVSSDELLKLESVPETMLVVGAGAVGLEWALIYSYLGSKVTVVEIMETIVPGTDREIATYPEKRTDQAEHHHPYRHRHQQSPPRRKGRPGFQKRGQGMARGLQQGPAGRRPHPQHRGIVRGQPRRSASTPRDSSRSRRTWRPRCPGSLPAATWSARRCWPTRPPTRPWPSWISSSASKPVAHHPQPAAIFTFPEMATVGLSEEPGAEREPEDQDRPLPLRRRIAGQRHRRKNGAGQGDRRRGQHDPRRPYRRRRGRRAPAPADLRRHPRA